MYDALALLSWISGYHCHIFTFVIIVILLWNSVVVGGNEIALIERRWFGSKMPGGGLWHWAMKPVSRRGHSAPVCTS